MGFERFAIMFLNENGELWIAYKLPLMFMKYTAIERV